MLHKILIFGAAAAVTCVFFINLCALVFQCGCHSLWAGAAAACNIHQTGVKHCPWCTENPVWALAAILGSQAVISFWPSGWSWGARLAGALAAFPIAGGIAALVYGLATGYWN